MSILITKSPTVLKNQQQISLGDLAFNYMVLMNKQSHRNLLHKIGINFKNNLQTKL